MEAFARNPILHTVLDAVPLRIPTAPIWVKTALADRLTLLDDHAQCELKAATNALALVGRNPAEDALVHQMSALAREEMLHYHMAREQLIGCGGQPTRPLPNPYVKALGAGRRGQNYALLDDLLIAALIEARSCERFVALVEGLREDDTENGRQLADFYDRLSRSESGHARLFLNLADSIYGDDALVREELLRRCDIEAQALESLPVSPRMHGGHRST